MPAPAREGKAAKTAEEVRCSFCATAVGARPHTCRKCNTAFCSSVCEKKAWAGGHKDICAATAAAEARAAKHAAEAAAACVVDDARCHICGEEGHVSRYCPRQGERALKPGTVQSEVDGKLGRWAAAREQKDYETADRIRAELMAVGVNPNKPAGKGPAKPK